MIIILYEIKMEYADKPSKKVLKKYNFIDVIKFLCAALVVTIHVPPLTSVNWMLNFAVVNFAARVAVPFFFISSSYFVFIKAYKENGELDKSVIGAYVKRIIRLYIIWSVIYAPFAYYHTAEIMGYVNILDFLKYYLFRFVLSTSYGHLWYLNAMIWAYVILLCLLSAGVKPRAIAIFSFAMYCLGLCAQSWFGLIVPLKSVTWLWNFLLQIKRFFETTRNGLCEGLLFIMMGMYFARHGFKMKVKTAFLCMCVSFIFYGAEVFVLTRLSWIREYDMYLGLIPTVFFSFYTAANIRLTDKGIYKELRAMSALIYFSHMIFVEILEIVPVFHAAADNSVVAYLFTFAASVCLAKAVIKLSKHFKPLLYLYK